MRFGQNTSPSVLLNRDGFQVLGVYTEALSTNVIYL
jgi:hypothetical protein